jgi:hypothetical protein
MPSVIRVACRPKKNLASPPCLLPPIASRPPPLLFVLRISAPRSLLHIAKSPSACGRTRFLLFLSRTPSDARLLESSMGHCVEMILTRFEISFSRLIGLFASLHPQSFIHSLAAPMFLSTLRRQPCTDQLSTRPSPWRSVSQCPVATMAPTSAGWIYVHPLAALIHGILIRKSR